MSDKDVSLVLSSEVVKPIIEAKVSGAIREALGDNGGQILKSVIDRILGQKYNATGEVDTYASRNAYTIVDVLAMRSIHNAVNEIIEEWVKEHQPAIKKALEKQLTYKRGAVAKTLIDGLVESLSSTWSFQVKVNLEQPKR